jgi:hypothetical protein
MLKPQPGFRSKSQAAALLGQTDSHLCKANETVKTESNFDDWFNLAMGFRVTSV